MFFFICVQGLLPYCVGFNLYYIWFIIMQEHQNPRRNCKSIRNIFLDLLNKQKISLTQRKYPSSSYTVLTQNWSWLATHYLNNWTRIPFYLQVRLEIWAIQANLQNRETNIYIFIENKEIKHYKFIYLVIYLRYFINTQSIKIVNFIK